MLNNTISSIIANALAVTATIGAMAFLLGVARGLFQFFYG